MSTSDQTDRLGLEAFDAVAAPDQWADIVRRAEATGGSAGSNVAAMRRGRGWYLAAAASVVALIGGLVVVTQLRNDDGATPIDQPGTGVADMTGCADESELDTIADVLRSGLPTYDYQPAGDLDDLLARTEVVVRGEITSAVREDVAGGPYTSMSITSASVLAIGSTSVVVGDDTVQGFSTWSLWPENAGPDPLSDRVSFDGLGVIAFLSADDVPFGWRTDIEGWFVACDGGPARGVIETPTFLDLSSLDALEAQITGVDPDTTVTTEPAPTDTSSPTTSPTTDPDDSVPESAVDERWTPTCVDRFGSADAPAADTGLDRFGPLGAVPGLDIVLPAFRSNDQAAPAATNVAVGRVDGGTAVLARPYEGEDTNTYLLSVIDDDGSVRWRRCASGAFAGVLLSSPGSDLVVVAEYTPGTTPDAPAWRTFDVVSGRDGAPLDIPGELQTVTTGERHVLFSLSDERFTTPDDEMMLLDLTTGELSALPYPDVTDLEAFKFGFQIIDGAGDELRILRRGAQVGVAVDGVWIDGAWQSDDATILEATPVRAVNSFDDAVGWEGRNGLGEVVWSRPDLLDLRREGFNSEVSESVTVINACRERDDATGLCGGGALIGLDTMTGETMWERADNRGVSAVGDGFAIITNDASDGWEMIDTLTGELVDESQQWTGIESFAQECCGAGDFIWVGRDGGVVFAVNEDHVRVWYPQARSSATISVALTD